MPESQIYYLGELVERKLDEVLQNTEFSLINYIGLTPEEANRTVGLALQNIIGRNSISQQQEPLSAFQQIAPQITRWRKYRSVNHNDTQQ